MAKMIKFIVFGEIVQWSRAGRKFLGMKNVGGKMKPITRTFTPTEQADYKAFVAWNAKAAMVGKKPLSGAVGVRLNWFFEPPKSWSEKKKQAALAGEAWHISKPDSDNLEKLLLDAMNAICYDDDKQACNVSKQKRYGFPKRVEVEIFEA